jgi:hypothetical protein
MDGNEYMEREMRGSVDVQAQEKRGVQVSWRTVKLPVPLADSPNDLGW